ncbi:CHAT domain-containing protein [Leptolyngbya sp. 'hensonii']|uniref:CHAT domain-containing protein n=1 Tax=Leptolyngbya sp. 'hensonii' TaxID=1922337 RepID=UPI0025B74403|nr:CHAT domain-containing protein [Leptolyngbya sp. 'hensonii']
MAPLLAAGPNNYAIWVLKAPSPGGFVHHDCVWPEPLTQTWHAWQEMFSLRGLPNVPRVSSVSVSPLVELPSLDANPAAFPPQQIGLTGRLMQHLGTSLWQWLLGGPIQSSFDQSQGIAIGQNKPLRLRLEIRDPDLVALPWEIMQPQSGKQAISLSQQLLFSRTTTAVDPLQPLRIEQSLKILLVLGQDVDTLTGNSGPLRASGAVLQLEQEASTLAQVLENCCHPESMTSRSVIPVPCRVDTLVQPTPAELTQHLETGQYNILFYAGHGTPAPDGGLLLLRSDTKMSGTELAQVLTRCRVTLAVFNACWGAQPDHDGEKAIPRSSLAEVLVHHGVPAVLAMRDSIADQEALSFIQAFAQALAERVPIDQAVAVARQHLLTLYKFNQPAWSLPVLYMHPEFNGELVRPVEEGMTELPTNPSYGWQHPVAALRLLGSTTRVWPIQGGLIRVGRKGENDLVIQEQWVSQKHAEIFCRDVFAEGAVVPTYFLRDFSRYGTLVLGPGGWQKVHHQEVPLQSGTQLKFGSSQGQALEFLIETPLIPDDV